MSVHNLQISTENLLGVILQMPDSEYDKFIEKANNLRRKSVKPAWTKTEIELIKKINDCLLSTEEQSLFDKLVKKRRAEKITGSELETLIVLAEKSEMLNVDRINYLIKLAKMKKLTLDEVMEKLGIKPPEIL
jgi:uncharacterized protein YnzC (UPF0291/DUF896 family)